MATLLTTAKMHPALVARIESSVSGRRRKPGGAVLAPRLVASVRLALALGLAFVIYAVVGVRRGERTELSRARTELLADVSKHSASLTDADRTSAARAEAWLENFSRSYDGEVIDGRLRAPGALASSLARPMMYVRGGIGAFSSSRHIVDAAGTSAKDALLLCLLEPPASRAEKDLLPRVRMAYAGGPLMEDRTKNVRRLHEAEVGLPFLSPAWAARVEAAPTLSDVMKLRRELDRAPIAAAKQAARAELLLVVMDEPGQGGGPTELDGERTHWVRVGLMELSTQKVLLSMRKLVDPSWISLAKKSEYESGLDGCGLAFDVREAVISGAAARP